jgi:hypothetical protein
MGFRSLIPFALVALLTGCSDGQGTADPRSGAPCPTNLQEVAVQVFQQSCIDAGCHGSADRAGGLDLETNALELELFGRDAALCDGQVRVLPGDAASSYLIAKLRGTNECGVQMPVGGSLPTETIDCIVSWIDGLDVTNSCETCGGAVCLDLTTSPDHCGSCGNACPDTAVCLDGACTCPSDLSVCDSSCVALASDPANCGSCGSSCGDLFCLQGECSADCGTLTECSGACVDLLNDDNHCGSCGTVCGPGSSCADGQCQCGSTTISFANDVQPILTGSCASTGCHDGLGAPGGPGGAGGPGGGATTLDLTVGSAYPSLLETTTSCGPVVVPGDAEGSVLIGKLTGTELCGGSQMPKADPPLAPELIDTIAAWICQGAENN